MMNEKMTQKEKDREILEAVAQIEYMIERTPDEEPLSWYLSIIKTMASGDVYKTE